MIVAEKREQLH